MRHLMLSLALATSLTLTGCGDGDTGSGGTTVASDVVDASAATLDTEEAMVVSDAITEVEDGESLVGDSDDMTDGEGTSESDMAAEPAPEDAASDLAPEEPPSGSPCAFPLVELQLGSLPSCCAERWPSRDCGASPVKKDWSWQQVPLES